MIIPDFRTFERLARRSNAIPLIRPLMSDQLSPVLGYRRLVSADERTAPSFLLESVEGGSRVGRYSMIGAQPSLEIVARGPLVTVRDSSRGTCAGTHETDPLGVPRRLGASLRPVARRDLAAAAPRGVVLPGFLGGWVGYAAYDAVRYLEPEKLPFSAAPHDDRSLPDLHLGLYHDVAVFDHVSKILFAISRAVIEEGSSPRAAYDAAAERLQSLVDRLEAQSVLLRAGRLDLTLAPAPIPLARSSFAPAEFERAVERAKAFIAAGDAFQIVLSQRFERSTTADPFDVYRALRIVNPSPYMIYLQAEGSILVASSPEILCHCEAGRVTSRPLAGTRRRGATEEEDARLEAELRRDEKERAEHVMLVDLARNDLARACIPESVRVERVMEVERYSHVMHLSSTVTGRLRPGLDCWDALRETLPVGTVSGAPKVRAMQIIDELEPTRRGPYAGAIGCASLGGPTGDVGDVGDVGDMDMAIALRTMIFPTAMRRPDGSWTVHLQAGAGVVADSDPAGEREETVSKAAALERAVDLAERAFG